MDQPDTTRDNTAADMAAPQASGGDEDQPADMAVEVEGMAQVAAALRAAQPDPAAIAAAAPSAAAFGHSGAAEATAAFFARYCADHERSPGHAARGRPQRRWRSLRIRDRSRRWSASTSGCRAWVLRQRR